MHKRAKHERIDTSNGSLNCDGTTTLRVSRAAMRRLTRALDEARGLCDRDIEAGEGLRRLAADARMIESVVPREVLRDLPACRGRARLSIIASDILRGGEATLSETKLMEVLRYQPLTLRELWAVPVALRICIAEALSRVCAAIADSAKSCADAEDWLDHPHRLHRVPDPDFIEHVLRRCGEERLPKPRERLEACLRRTGMSAEVAIRQAHDARAHRLLRLENLMSAARRLNDINWQSCFEALSGVDAELRRDPAGVYPRMDEESRRAVLEQVSVIARAAGMSEQAVARHAVSATRTDFGSAPDQGKGLEGLDSIDPETTCCWWLYTDAGRAALLARMGRPHARLPRLVPDSRGIFCMCAILALTAAIILGLWRWLPAHRMALVSLPAAWVASDVLLDRLFPLVIRPARILKLDVKALPDGWRTLIVTPVLLTDVSRAEAACDNLEALGCLEDDPNLACLLLGDFADADRQALPEDDAIVRRARERIAEMNRRAGREKYYYLHRPRTLLEPDGRYMGRDRKRGALMDLNRVLLGGESDFGIEGAACAALRGRYAFVITLDADTRMLPGTVHRLVGALAHPLNRRYAVLQPRMEVAPASVDNRFALMASGVGGLDTYPTRVSSRWMDLTGVGIYGGKGIYRVSDFQNAVTDRLPEGRVLSHDLIEGALAGTGYLSDVALYDGCPATLRGWMQRQHRWTRGDWQLLPLMLSKRLPLSPADRFRMLDNLLRSLRAPALFLLMLLSAWRGSIDGATAGLLLLFVDAILHPLDGDQWRHSLVGLFTLPLTAHRMADAALRALWRVCVSGRHLMDWVPSIDADRALSRADLTGRLAALLTLPGLLNPEGMPMALALMLLYWVGADWVRDMEQMPLDDAPPLTDEQRDFLLNIARDTWRFFSENVPADSPALPPDNVQLDPPVGAARRTSPTNIGLYLLSCVSAMVLGFIDPSECSGRIANALDAVDRTEKWRGHLFNWIDIDAFTPLKPRYVSAVDSGNLAACALACSNLIDDEKLAARLRGLAEGMDFSALYDDHRHLFFIGMDVDANAPSASHYDLLASESRILSYTAMMLHQVPLKHWAHLGRGCVSAGGGAALVSWSGTMFEYLMPELLMRAPVHTLLGASARRAVRAQMAAGGPWGISESGYHAFDAQMNYQYRAFGLKALALGGGTDGGVIAPYASALALSAQPRRAADNLALMARLGWRDAQGFYEAADAIHPNADGTPSLVKSHMAHHQGMALCAICNALTGDRLVAGFMADPRARALSLLLEERPACVRRLKPLPRAAHARPASAHVQRAAKHDLDVHLLSGRHVWALVTPEGAVHYVRNGVDVTRFYGDLTDRPDAARLHLRVDGVPVKLRLSCRYDAGCARFEGAAGALSVRMTVSLSPEDDTLYRAVDIKNTGNKPLRVALMDAVPVALARARDFRAHPAFQLLFVESEYLGEDGLLFRRRPRNPGESCPTLVHRAFTRGAVARESRYENVFDREGFPRFELTGKGGATINPVSALMTEVALSPGSADRVCFALRLCDAPEERTIPCQPERAELLGRSRAEAMLGFLGIAPGLYHRLDRLTVLLMDPGLAAWAKADHTPAPGTPREALWAMGISGDHPILSMVVADPSHTSAVQGIIRAQSFFRAMGLTTDLVLIDSHAGGYDRPVSTMLDHMLDASSLRDRDHVFLLSDLTAEQIGVIRRASALALTSDRSFAARVRSLLDALEPRAQLDVMNPGKTLLPIAGRTMDNGYGGFTRDGYEIDVRPGVPLPAPWCNLLATDGMGLLLTERGGGFIWHDNSRFCRLTGYRGDPAMERFPLAIEVITDSGERLPLLPGRIPAFPYRVNYTPDSITYSFSNARASGRVAFEISDSAVLIGVDLNLQSFPGELRARVDWLMGALREDAVCLKTWHNDGALFASGTADGVGFLTCDSPEAECRDGLCVPVHPGDNHLELAVGWAEDLEKARTLARDLREGTRPEVHREHNPLMIQTPDEALNHMMNTFLPHQVRAARVNGRTGYYQPGGAYGFRDQLQDMLALIPLEPHRVRAHLLMCAGRQFAAGDALHWWHMPFSGVRTRIQDDRLFLPYVTATYVRQTGDSGILDEVIPYLEDVPIPEDQEDVFQAMTPGNTTTTLHDHCMRAFRATDTAGPHGLALMGAGDWNDGMNRVGHLGRGESVWLSEFLAACADRYAEICPVEADAVWLRGLARRHRGAVELYGWDGQWYLRAFTDDGTPLGSADGACCRIDLIAQAWAELCGLSPDRCHSALDAAWDMLADERHGILRLLTPPFDGGDLDPGYIRGYPGGIRENGAQYTHAACWFLLALIHSGDADRAHRLLHMLLPPNHADTSDKVKRYRVEPYVMAADVYDLDDQKGRGGWTWYTGSASWMYMGVLMLLGYERRGDRVRLCALLGHWPEVSVTLRHGNSRYRLICDQEYDRVTLDGRVTGEDDIALIDDGRDHEAHFPPRRA